MNNVADFSKKTQFHVTITVYFIFLLLLLFFYINILFADLIFSGTRVPDGYR